MSDIDKIKLNGTVYNIKSGSGGSTDVQINGTSIVSNNTANILTNTAYNSSTNKIATMSDIPSEVTETTVSNWGFTKNTGTITGVTMNGVSKGTSGVVDLGTVITDVSGKLDTSKVKKTKSTVQGNVYDVTYINSALGDIETLLSAI